MSNPDVSIVIPTFNRKESIRRTLESLARQSFQAGCLEVIVVDDGGNDGTEEVLLSHQPYTLRYLRQSNSGATIARNRGATAASGDFLVFVDDDIELFPGSLQMLINELAGHSRTVVLGRLILPDTLLSVPPLAQLYNLTLLQDSEGERVSFQECLTGFLGVRRLEFVELGMFSDPTGGWPNWDDLDFGFRAHDAGFAFWRCNGALAFHWDYSVASLEIACQRWYRAGKSAVHLFQRHPTLRSQMSMFTYKEGINWSNDSKYLILRKLAMRGLYSHFAIAFLKRMIAVHEVLRKDSWVLRQLYRWVVSASIYMGYHDGIAEQRLPVT